MADTREIGRLLAVVGGVVLIAAALLEQLFPWLTRLLQVPIVQWVGEIAGLVPFLVVLIAGIVGIFSWKTVKTDNTLLWGIIDLVFALLALFITLSNIVSLSGLGGVILLIGGVLLIVDAL